MTFPENSYICQKFAHHAPVESYSYPQNPRLSYTDNSKSVYSLESIFPYAIPEQDCIGYCPMSPPDDHILFITLDSCRFDTFAESRIPNLKAIAPFYKAQSPGYFTYGSHWPCLSVSHPASPAALRRFSIRSSASSSSLSTWGIPSRDRGIRAFGAQYYQKFQ
jgi:hypothetical protein